MRKSTLLLFCMLLAGPLSGCGQTGALYLPDDPPQAPAAESPVEPGREDPDCDDC